MAPGVNGLRRECRTNADFPALLLCSESLARQLQAGHLSGHFTITVAIQRTYRYKQGAARARR